MQNCPGRTIHPFDDQAFEVASSFGWLRGRQTDENIRPGQVGGFQINLGHTSPAGTGRQQGQRMSQPAWAISTSIVAGAYPCPPRQQA